MLEAIERAARPTPEIERPITFRIAACGTVHLEVGPQRWSFPADDFVTFARGTQEVAARLQQLGMLRPASLAH